MKNNSIRARLTALSQKIDSPSRDEYYDTPEARIDTIVGRDSVYYLRLRAVKQEWDKSDNPVRQEFQEYLRETYGIEMTIQPEGVDLKYRILDEQKHTLFLLKFGA
jgi:hypothetical protein